MRPPPLIPDGNSGELWSDAQNYFDFSVRSFSTNVKQQLDPVPCLEIAAAANRAEEISNLI